MRSRTEAGLVLLTAVLLLGLVAWAQSGEAHPKPAKRQATKAPRRKMPHATREMSDREKQETRQIKAEQRREQKLIKKQQKAAKRSARRPKTEQ